MVDNFSRRILAWKVAGTFDPSATAEILLAASKGVVSAKPVLLADGGIENFNGAVDELIGSGVLSRVLAQTEIAFSNSSHRMSRPAGWGTKGRGPSPGRYSLWITAQQRGEEKEPSARNVSGSVTILQASPHLGVCQ